MRYIFVVVLALFVITCGEYWEIVKPSPKVLVALEENPEDPKPIWTELTDDFKLLFGMGDSTADNRAKDTEAGFMARLGKTGGKFGACFGIILAALGLCVIPAGVKLGKKKDLPVDKVVKVGLGLINKRKKGEDEETDYKELVDMAKKLAKEKGVDV